jgi:hypothetical protein
MEPVRSERNPYFSPLQWDRLKLYVWYLRDEMGLSGWRVVLGHHTPAEEQDEAHMAMGYVVPVEGRYIAWVYLSNDFPEAEPDKQRHILVHELAHLYTRDALTVVETAFKQLSEPAYNIAWPMYKEAMELQVDEIARTMAPLFKLPNLNKPLGKKARQRLERIQD